MLLEKNIDIP